MLRLAREAQFQVGRAQPRRPRAASRCGRWAELLSQLGGVEAASCEPHSPVGTWLRTGSWAWRPLGPPSSPRRDATAREKGVGAAPRNSRRLGSAPQLPAHLFRPQAPSAWRAPKARLGRRQGCGFEKLRLLLPLRTTGASRNFSIRS